MMNHSICAGLLERWLLALVLCFIPAATTTGQAPSAQITILRAARLIDGTGAPSLQPAMIRIEGERIVEVGSNLRVPAGARVIELGDATLLPGTYRSTHTPDWRRAPALGRCADEVDPAP